MSLNHCSPRTEVIVQGAGLNRFGRAASYIILTALLGIATVTLSQCTQVGDSLTGVDLAKTSSRKHGSKCIRECNRTFHCLERQERKLHKQNLKACKGDDECKEAEKARHKAEIQRLEQARKACKAGCHKQGSGYGG